MNDVFGKRHAHARVRRTSVWNGCVLLNWTIYPFCAGIDFRRQNLTSIDVGFWRLTSISALQGWTYLSWQWIPNIGIQMKRKHLRHLWWLQIEINVGLPVLCKTMSALSSVLRFKGLMVILIINMCPCHSNHSGAIQIMFRNVHSWSESSLSPSVSPASEWESHGESHWCEEWKSEERKKLFVCL